MTQADVDIAVLAAKEPVDHGLWIRCLANVSGHHMEVRDEMAKEIPCG